MFTCQGDVYMSMAWLAACSSRQKAGSSSIVRLLEEDCQWGSGRRSTALLPFQALVPCLAVSSSDLPVCTMLLPIAPTAILLTLFVLFLCLFLSLWPFQLYFIPWLLPTTIHFLILLFWSYTYFCLIGPFNYIFNYESLPQPWYNPLWLTGLKAITK